MLGSDYTVFFPPRWSECDWFSSVTTHDIPGASHLPGTIIRLILCSLIPELIFSSNGKYFLDRVYEDYG